MERKPKVEQSGPPSPSMVALTSLFVYPGVGHFMVKQFSRGLVFGGLFTLGVLGMIAEMWNMLGPILKMYSGEALALSSTPVSWGRMAFWFLTTSALWLGGAWHAYSVARTMVRESASTAVPDEES